jgi:hypothetical protein
MVAISMENARVFWRDRITVGAGFGAFALYLLYKLYMKYTEDQQFILESTSKRGAYLRYSSENSAISIEKLCKLPLSFAVSMEI